MINHEFSDDDDIKREIRNMLMRSNILIRRYCRCSIAVKLLLFQAYCMCLYDTNKTYLVTLAYSCAFYSKFKSIVNV